MIQMLRLLTPKDSPMAKKWYDLGYRCMRCGGRLVLRFKIYED